MPNKETYFTKERGMINKHSQNMSVDESKRLVLINQHQIETPAPHTYQNRQRKEGKLQSDAQKIKN